MSRFPATARRFEDGRYVVILKEMVYGLDAMLRRFRHIYEFSQDERCLLRLSIGESQEDLNLSDGTCVNQGDLVGELHLWNEHIPPVRQEGPDLGWALTFQRQLSFSFRELATYVQTDARCQGVVAFRGELSFGGPYRVAHFKGLAGRWGFDLVSPEGRTGLRRRLMDWGTNLYAWGLIWAFNPASLGGDGAGQLRRDQIWISREVLLQKYGAPKPRVDQGEGSASSSDYCTRCSRLAHWGSLDPLTRWPQLGRLKMRRRLSPGR